MPKGNDADPFQHGGIDWAGNSASDRSRGISESNDGADPADSWGPGDICGEDGINWKGNRRKDKESKYSEETTVVDAPLRASVARVKKTSAQAYEPDDWYKGPKEG